MHKKFSIKNIETILDLTNDAISVADEKGNTILVNAAYTKITGLPKEAVINKPVTVDIAEGESMHIKVLKTGKAVRNVHMKVGPAGKEVIVNVEPIYIDGKLAAEGHRVDWVDLANALDAEITYETAKENEFNEWDVPATVPTD